MNLVNKQVTHTHFGKGSVVKYNDSYIEVCFSSGTKKFVFPDALETYLMLVDEKTADLVNSMKEKIEKERKKKELELQRKRTIEYEKRQRLLERKKLIKNHKLYNVSQVAFWCDKEEEDKVFTEWKIFIGVKKSGVNKGKPNKLIRVHPNSACIITSRAPDMPEKDRRILGVFMVDETFIGKLCEDGYIPAHSKYRLRLSEEESKKMLFWKYYINERYPNNMTWNSGRTRYFDNLWMAQILQDIISLKEKSNELEFVQQFFEHFCQMNRLAYEDLPQPHGALVHIKETKNKQAEKQK